MNKEDYFKYYIQGSEHYLIPKDVFNELFDEMESWKQDTNKYKGVIDKIKECINEFPIIHYSSIEKVNKKRLSGKLIPVGELLDILKEVE